MSHFNLSASSHCHQQFSTPCLRLCLCTISKSLLVSVTFATFQDGTWSPPSSLALSPTLVQYKFCAPILLNIVVCSSNSSISLLFAFAQDCNSLFPPLFSIDYAHLSASALPRLGNLPETVSLHAWLSGLTAD